MKAIVDQETCIGCGVCAQVAPEIYEMQGDKAVSIADEIAEDKIGSAKEGAEQCPVDAISVE